MFRLAAVRQAIVAGGALEGVRSDHFAALLAGIAAGRAELIDMFKAGRVDVEVLHRLEKELDADEIRARHLLGTTEPARTHTTSAEPPPPPDGLRRSHLAVDPARPEV